MALAFTILFGLFLAYANGSNDNFKGVATLFGSKTTTYNGALAWATLTTILGSITALVLAQGLLSAFSGKGLVPDAVVNTKSFSVAVSFGAAITVILATRLGFPISTTHALMGALVGAGIFASEAGVNFHKLSSSFIAPLLFSPFLAILLASIVYFIFRFARVRFRVAKETCLCIGTEVIGVVPKGATPGQALAMYQGISLPTITLGSEATCSERYAGNVFGLNADSLLNGLHYVSAGIVCFARGLNDTPKIAAMLLIAGAIAPSWAIFGVTIAMALGGILNSKKIAETMSHNVTAMNTGQGFSANVVTSVLVILASKLGLPVSTTHVACGSLFGIGFATKQARWKTIQAIVLAWVITLPVAAILSAGLFAFLR